MSSRMLLAILGLSAKSVVEEEDDARELVVREEDDGAKAVAPVANVARVRAAEKSFMVAVISVYPTVFLVMMMATLFCGHQSSSQSSSKICKRFCAQQDLLWWKISYQFLRFGSQNVSLRRTP